jgi:hypothetical protein
VVAAVPLGGAAGRAWWQVRHTHTALQQHWCTAVVAGGVWRANITCCFYTEAPLHRACSHNISSQGGRINPIFSITHNTSSHSSTWHDVCLGVLSGCRSLGEETFGGLAGVLGDADAAPSIPQRDFGWWYPSRKH